MTTNQETSQYFYDLFELDLEEYENYENVQEIIHNLIIFFKIQQVVLVKVKNKRIGILELALKKLDLKNFFKDIFKLLI